MSLNPFSLDIMTSPLHPIYQGCDNYDYSGTHMGERKVVVTLQSESPIDFMIGDYVIYNGEKFTLQTSPITGRIFSSHMLSYTLIFWWAGYELQLANFLDVIPSGDDSSVYYNKTSEVIINDTILIICGRIIANLDRSGYAGWSFDIHGDVDITTPKDIEAINLQCYDVLQNISTVFGVEYQFDNATKTIKIGYPPEVTTLFEYGKDKGICEINRVQNDQKVITRVRAYGSTRNITPEYRHVPDTLEYHARLILPEDQSPLPVPNEQYSIIDGYLVDTIKEAAYGIREGVPYINEDIYPSIEGLNNTVFAVGGITDRPTESTPQYNTVVVTPEWTEWRLKYAYQGEIWQEAHPDAVPEYIEIIHPAVVKEELVETVPQGTYDTATFFVPDLGIDINREDLDTGTDPQISFTSGDLSGMTFTIASFTKHMTLIAGVPTWDDGTIDHNQLWKVTVIRNSEDPNHIIPSEIIHAKAGDTYVFLNIFLPAIYEDPAEAKLLTAAIEYLKANTKSPEGYAIRLSEEYFTKYPLTLGKFKEGNAVTIRDTLLGLTERAVLIQSMSVSYKDNALLPVYNLTISDVPIKGSLDVLRSGLKQSNQTITSRIATVENTTNSVLKSAYILTSRILDNNLDIRGSIIAAQSITPISQSVELKSAHYMLQAVFTVNYEGAVNAANGSAGVLIHKEEDVVWANTYDLTHQTWTIVAPQTFALLDGVRYYAYIKGSLTDGTAVWVVSETKILATQDLGFYYFEWGSVLAPIEGSRYTQTSIGLSHNPVSVDPASAAMASIDPVTQVLTVTELLPIKAIEDTKGLTGFVNPSDIDVSYNWTNRTITLTGVLDYYWRGKLHTLSSPWTSSAHANTVGKWMLYSTDGETFVWATTMWSFADIQVSFVNRQATAAASFAICETHGTMDWLSHEEDHQVNGTYLLSGGKATAGTYALNTATDAANSPGFDQARLKDEDRETNIPAWIEGTYTTMYVGASNTSIFSIVATLPFVSSGSYLQVNNALTGAMTDGINNRFYNVYQILIPCTSDADSQKFRTVFLQPQKVHTTQVEAETEAVNGLLFGELEALTPEFKVYSRITYATSAGDLNTGKCRIASITYVLGTKGNPINVGGVVPTNHAALSNLPWVDSAHTGTANKIAGFGVSGEAVEIDIPSLPLEITGITLLSASWTLVSTLYEYDLANANITANHVVDVIPENADITIVKAAEILPKTVSSAGSVKLYATNAPTGNIGVTIILTTATT